MSKEDTVRKSAYINEEHQEYLQDTGKNFSLWVRNKIEEEMQKDGYEVEK